MTFNILFGAMLGGFAGMFVGSFVGVGRAAADGDSVIDDFEDVMMKGMSTSAAGAAIGAVGGGLVGWLILDPMDEQRRAANRAAQETPEARAWAAQHAELPTNGVGWMR